MSVNTLITNQWNETHNRQVDTSVSERSSIFNITNTLSVVIFLWQPFGRYLWPLTAKKPEIIMEISFLTIHILKNKDVKHLW